MSAMEIIIARHDDNIIHSVDVADGYLQALIDDCMNVILHVDNDSLHPLSINADHMTNMPIYMPVTPTTVLSATSIFDLAYDQSS